MKRLAFITAIILLLIISVTAYFQYNLPRNDVAVQHTDISIDANQLYQHYFEDEMEANAKYLDKVIEVTGSVSDVQNTNERIVLLMNAGDGLGGINCSMKEASSLLAKQNLGGKTVRVKGKCTGFLMDVNLVDCVLVQPKNN